jgi:diacylglycerol kinase family enzyme
VRRNDEVASRRASTRIAAWLALVAAGIVVASLGVLAVRHLLTVVVFLIALALAGAGAWVAATRRGIVRGAAAACAMLALVGGMLALVLSGAFEELVVLALSFALFGVAGRRALARSPEERRLHAPRGDRKVLLINPHSGDGRAERANLAGEAARRGIEPVVLEPGDDLRSLANDAAARADVIGMAGGDGSQALVADVASARGVAYVCIPAGTRNHFALDLGVDREDVVGALDAFDSDIEHLVDLAHVNQRAFVNNVSLGAYAEIVQDEAYRGAKLATAGRMIPDLLGDDASRPLRISFVGPDGEVSDTARLLLVSNNPYVLGRLVGFGGRPRLDTGRLGILAIEIAGAADAAALVSLEALGRVQRFEGWNEWSAEELAVDTDGPVSAGVDGEAVVLDPPLVFTTEPHALRVRLSPASDRRRLLRAQTHGGATELVRNLWHAAAH